MNVGERIRAQRRSLRMSQSELAGNYFNRSYISRIENGQVVPPVATLEILAERLQKPVSYFIDEPANLLRERQIVNWWRRGQRLLNDLEFEEALEVITQVIEWASGSTDQDVLMDAHVHAAYALVCLDRFPEASQHLRTAFDLSARSFSGTVAGGEEAVARYHYTVGKMSFLAGHYDDAIKDFEQIDRLDAPRELYVKSLVALGSCRLRTGDAEGAREVYQQALDECPQKLNSLRAQSLHGLGAAHGRLGNLDLAAHYSDQAATLYRDEDPYKYHQAQHNVGLALLESGQLERAASTLQQVCKFYHRQEDHAAAASCLLDRVRAETDPAQRLKLLEQARDFAAQAGEHGLYTRALRAFLEARQDTGTALPSWSQAVKTELDQLGAH